MSEFRIFETDEFLKRFKKLSPQDSEILRRKLDRLVYPQIKEEPFFGNNIKKLKGNFSNTWRYRMGKFRLFYKVDRAEQIVFILTIENRKDAYR